jgi:hypothetical protein
MTQIFLPCPNFAQSAQCLDNRRLPKNMVEAMQVYSYNVYGTSRQGNPHPYEMWRGYENILLLYIHAMYQEWQARYADGRRKGSLYHKSGEDCIKETDKSVLAWRMKHSGTGYVPDWWDNEEIFSAYRAALLYKDYGWYSKFGWSELPAVPVKIDAKGNSTLPYVYGEGKDNDE